MKTKQYVKYMYGMKLNYNTKYEDFGHNERYEQY